MDEDRARDFWERALGEIEDGGFFTTVQIAAPPEAKPAAPVKRTRRRHPTNLELVVVVILVSLLLVLAVVSWLAPALF